MALEHTGADADVAAIRTVTDNLPNSGSLTDLAGIKAVTDNLPNSGSLTDLATIRAVTDNLPNSGALTTISGGTNKIDALASNGLSGVEDSVAYRIHETERHMHSWERWFGLATAPNGEIHVADSIGDGTAVAPFVPDAGNDVYGGWTQILGSSDTPATAGNAFYDLHRLMIVAVENANNTHFVQLAFGTSGDAAVTAGTYTEFVFRPQSVQGSETIIIAQMRRVAAGTKAWVRLLVRGQNTSTMSIYIGLHEYEG